jgi:hypothetical protein
VAPRGVIQDRAEPGVAVVVHAEEPHLPPEVCRPCAVEFLEQPLAGENVCGWPHLAGCRRLVCWCGRFFSCLGILWGFLSRVSRFCFGLALSRQVVFDGFIGTWDLGFEPMRNKPRPFCFRMREQIEALEEEAGEGRAGNGAFPQRCGQSMGWRQLDKVSGHWWIRSITVRTAG